MVAPRIGHEVIIARKVLYTPDTLVLLGGGVEQQAHCVSKLHLLQVDAGALEPLQLSPVPISMRPDEDRGGGGRALHR